MNIKNVVAITPVWNEPLGMIQKFLNGIEAVRKNLTERGIGFRHFFLDDGAVHLPDEFSILERHQKNEGLAKILVDGYNALFAKLKSLPDLIIRLDCQEHDPSKIPFIVDHFSHCSKLEALFLPVWYWTEGEDRPLMKEITMMTDRFIQSLSPINKEDILKVYNQKFPLGYQVFRTTFLKKILPRLNKSLEVFEKKFGTPATWGLDLMAILLAAEESSDAIDFVFGGWSEPWKENRGSDKIEAQRKKAEAMLKVFAELS